MWHYHNSCEDLGKWSKGLTTWTEKRDVKVSSAFLLRSLLLVLRTLVLTSPHAIRITSLSSADSKKSLHRNYKFPLKTI